MNNNVIHVTKKMYIWWIGNDADNYVDRSHNLSAVLKLIYPLKSECESRQNHSRAFFSYSTYSLQAVYMLHMLRSTHTHTCTWVELDFWSNAHLLADPDSQITFPRGRQRFSCCLLICVESKRRVKFSCCLQEFSPC